MSKRNNVLMNNNNNDHQINFSLHYVRFLVLWNVRTFAPAYGVIYFRYSANGMIYIRMWKLAAYRAFVSLFVYFKRGVKITRELNI